MPFPEDKNNEELRFSDLRKVFGAANNENVRFSQFYRDSTTVPSGTVNVFDEFLPVNGESLKLSEYYGTYLPLTGAINGIIFNETSNKKVSITLLSENETFEYYYVIEGIEAADINVPLEGVGTGENIGERQSSSTLDFKFISDALLEGTQQFTLKIYKDSDKSPNTLYFDRTIDLEDTSVPLNFVYSNLTLNETSNKSLTVTVKPTDSTITSFYYYYEIILQGNFNNNDIQSVTLDGSTAGLSGVVDVNNKESSQLVILINEDRTTERDEFFKFRAWSSEDKEVLLQDKSFTVLDTSFTPSGSRTFTSSGTFIVPQDVYEISAVGIGAGASGSAGDPGNGGGGGGLRWVSRYPVTPGQRIFVSVGSSASVEGILSAFGGSGTSGGSGSYSRIVTSLNLPRGGGNGGNGTFGDNFIPDGRFEFGGSGSGFGGFGGSTGSGGDGGAGGGAGGYNDFSFTNRRASGGRGSNNLGGGGGGGSSLLGSSFSGGSGGSGGNSGGNGGFYGGGGGGGDEGNSGGSGGRAGVRIVWGGSFNNRYEYPNPR